MAEYRISDAARASGVNLHVLKKWFARGVVHMFSNQKGGRWNAFRPSDIAHFAIVVELVKTGVNVEIAQWIGEECLTATGEKASPAKIKNHWFNKYLEVFEIDGEDGQKYLIHEGRFMDETVRTSRRLFDIHEIIYRAFERLDEITSED